MGVAIICVDAILYAIITRVRVPSLCVTFGGAALMGLHLVLNGLGLVGGILGLSRGAVERGYGLAALVLQLIDLTGCAVIALLLVS